MIHREVLMSKNLSENLNNRVNQWTLNLNASLSYESKLAIQRKSSLKIYHIERRNQTFFDSQQTKFKDLKKDGWK